MSTYKVCLIGDSGVGKTSWLNRLMGEEIESMYRQFEVVESKEKEKFGGLRVDEYRDSDCCIIMYDVSKLLTARNISCWIRDYRNTCPNNPIIIVGNKLDLGVSKFEKRKLPILGKNETLVRISVIKGINIKLPLTLISNTLR